MVRRRFLTVVVGLMCAACLLVLAPTPAESHEAGQTKVEVRFDEAGGYAVSLTTDAEALLARLEAARKLPRSTPTSIHDYQRQFDRVCSELGAHVQLAFDGLATALTPTCTVDTELTSPDFSMSTLGVTVRARGRVPEESRTFTWSYGLTFTAYALAAPHDGKGEPDVVWLEGGQQSPALPIVRGARDSASARLRRAFAAGFGSVVPRGWLHVVLVLGLVVGNRRWPAALTAVSVIGLTCLLGAAIGGLSGVSVPWWGAQAALAAAVVAIGATNVLSQTPLPWVLPAVVMAGLAQGASNLGEASAVFPSVLVEATSRAAGVWVALVIVTGMVQAMVGFAPQHEPGRHNHRRSTRQPVLVPISLVMMVTGLYALFRYVPA